MTEHPNTKLIPLTQGKFTIVDAEDYLSLQKYSWRLQKSKNKTTVNYYATTFKRYGKKTTTLMMHRIIMGDRKGFLIDHINGDGLDNRKKNLRWCTPSQNNMNKSKVEHGHAPSSKYKGVVYHKKDKIYTAMVHLNRKIVFRKSCSTEIEAAIAYNVGAIKYHGRFAKLNDIPAAPIRKE